METIRTPDANALPHFQKRVPRADTLFPPMRTGAGYPACNTRARFAPRAMAWCDGTTVRADARRCFLGYARTQLRISGRAWTAGGLGTSDGTPPRTDAQPT